MPCNHHGPWKVRARFCFKPRKPACVFAHAPGLLLHRIFAAKWTAHMAFGQRILTKSERIGLIRKLYFKEATWQSGSSERTLEIRILHKFKQSMFSQKNTSDKAIPKMSSSSLGLLHSLGPYYTAIWKDISLLVPFNFPLSSLKLLQRIVEGFFFYFFKSLLCFHHVHMMKSFLLMVWLMGAFLNILVLVINLCSHLITCCLINLMKSVCVRRAYSLWPTSSIKNVDEPTTFDCNAQSFSRPVKKSSVWEWVIFAPHWIRW